MSRDRPPPSSHSRPHRTLAAGTAAPPERSQPSGAPEASPTLPSSSCSPHPSGRQYAHPPAAPSPPRSRPLQHSPPRPWTDPERRPPPGRLRPRPQGTAERRTHRRLYQDRPLRLTAPSTTPPPRPSATPSATARTAPNVTISHDQAGTWLRQDDILKQPVTTSTEIGQAYDFDAGGCPAITFYDADPSIDSERKRGGDNAISSIKVRQTMSNHTSFVVTSGPTPVEAIPDELASTDAWHQFLSSTRVAGLDAGVMG